MILSADAGTAPAGPDPAAQWSGAAGTDGVGRCVRHDVTRIS